MKFILPLAYYSQGVHVEDVKEYEFITDIINCESPDTLKQYAYKYTNDLVSQIDHLNAELDDAKKKVEIAQNQSPGLLFGKTAKKSEANSHAIASMQRAIMEMNNLLQFNIQLTMLSSKFNVFFINAIQDAMVTYTNGTEAGNKLNPASIQSINIIRSSAENYNRKKSQEDNIFSLINKGVEDNDNKIQYLLQNEHETKVALDSLFATLQQKDAMIVSLKNEVYQHTLSIDTLNQELEERDLTVQKIQAELASMQHGTVGTPTRQEEEILNKIHTIPGHTSQSNPSRVNFVPVLSLVLSAIALTVAFASQFM